MGANESKPASSTMWKASGPSGVSQDLLDSFQSNSETDASRARLMELQVQTRVAEELRKLQQKESEALKLAHEKIAAAPLEDDKGPSHFTLSKEVQELRRKLEERKQVRALPDNVEAARNEVIHCLRDHDRRPLNCWQEVENFKAEVKKLEQTWVNKVAS